jgi:hypothetical protein
MIMAPKSKEQRFLVLEAMKDNALGNAGLSGDFRSRGAYAMREEDCRRNIEQLIVSTGLRSTA